MSRYSFHTSMRSSFGTVRLGKSFDALIPAGAKVLTTNTQANLRTTSYDTNADGVADLYLTESLDAQGNTTTRTLSGFQSDAKGNYKSYSVSDSNHDGKIDGFSRQTNRGYSSTTDSDFDGKADSQFSERLGKNGQATSTDSFLDSDHDGKADYDYKGRVGRKSDVLTAPVIAGNGAGTLGAPIEHVVPVGGTKVSESDTATGRSIGFDVNADGGADIWESDSLDANGKTTARWYSVSDPAQQGKYLGSLGDQNADGLIDYVSVQNADGSSVAAGDSNGDGKLDYQTVSKTDGSYLSYSDSNADGVADWVTTGGKIA